MILKNYLKEHLKYYLIIAALYFLVPLAIELLWWASVIPGGVYSAYNLLFCILGGMIVSVMHTVKFRRFDLFPALAVELCLVLQYICSDGFTPPAEIPLGAAVLILSVPAILSAVGICLSKLILLIADRKK